MVINWWPTILMATFITLPTVVVVLWWLDWTSGDDGE